MRQPVAPLEGRSLRSLLVGVGMLFLVWCGVLLWFPTGELMQSGLKVIVWLVPLSLWVRGQQDLATWGIDFGRHWKPVLAAATAFLLYFGVTGHLQGRNDMPNLSVTFFLNGILIAPPVEELIFRGILLRQLARKVPFWTANVASAAIFAVYHLPLWVARDHGLNLAALPWVLTAGLVFGWAFWKTKSLGVAALVHGLHNLLIQVLL